MGRDNDEAIAPVERELRSMPDGALPSTEAGGTNTSSSIDDES